VPVLARLTFSSPLGDFVSRVLASAEERERGLREPELFRLTGPRPGRRSARGVGGVLGVVWFDEEKGGAKPAARSSPRA